MFEIGTKVCVIANSWSDLPQFAIGIVTEFYDQYIGVSFEGSDTAPYWFYPSDLNSNVDDLPITVLDFVVERTVYGDPAMENVF